MPDEQNANDLGSGAFIDGTDSVINYQGNNYYKACGHIVTEFEEDVTTCVKRMDHPTWDHEDWNGTVRMGEFSYSTTFSEAVRNSAKNALVRSGLDVTQAYNALNSLAYARFSLRVGD